MICKLYTPFLSSLDTPPPGYLSEEGETTDSQDMGKPALCALGLGGGHRLPWPQT